MSSQIYFYGFRVVLVASRYLKIDIDGSGHLTVGFQVLSGWLQVVLGGHGRLRMIADGFK